MPGAVPQTVGSLGFEKDTVHKRVTSFGATGWLPRSRIACDDALSAAPQVRMSARSTISCQWPANEPAGFDSHQSARRVSRRADTGTVHSSDPWRAHGSIRQKPQRSHFFADLPLAGMCRYDITLSVSSVASLTASLLRAITPATRPSIRASTAMLELVSTG